MKKDQKKLLEEKVLFFNGSIKNNYEKIINYIDILKEEKKKLNVEASKRKMRDIINFEDWKQEETRKKYKILEKEYIEAQEKENVLNICLKYYDNKINFLEEKILYFLENYIKENIFSMRDLKEMEKIIKNLEDENKIIFGFYRSDSKGILNCYMKHKKFWYSEYSFLCTKLLASQFYNGKFNYYIEDIKNISDEYWENRNNYSNKTNEELKNVTYDIEELKKEIIKITNLKEEHKNALENFINKQKNELIEKDVLNVNGFLS